MAFDAQRATAVADAYLRTGADRRPYMETVSLAACRFQDDPHNQKITISSFEEYANNETHLRDRLLLASVRVLAGWVKMPGERDCFARLRRNGSTTDPFRALLVPPMSIISRRQTECRPLICPGGQFRLARSEASERSRHASAATHALQWWRKLS